MLKFLMRYFYHDVIYTTEPELFYKLYKWPSGLFTLLSLRRILFTVIFGVIGIIWLIFVKPRAYGLCFILVAFIFICNELIETKKIMEVNKVEIKTPFQIRTEKMEFLIRKFVSKNGKALGLYNDLLNDKCNYCCYYYSLEIAKIIKDSTLIWGAIEDVFEDGHRFCAHAVILRNGYIYDSNLRQSEKYEDFIKLYNFKFYKQWNYDEYSGKDFRKSERAEFKKWCKENNVCSYEKF